MRYVKAAAAAILVFLTAEAVGAFFVFLVMEGPPGVKRFAFIIGSAAALAGALIYLGLGMAGKSPSPLFGALAGAALTALAQGASVGTTSPIGFLFFCAVGGMIGAAATLPGWLFLRRFG